LSFQGDVHQCSQGLYVYFECVSLFLSINNHFFFLFSFVWCEIAGEKDEEYLDTQSPSHSPSLSPVDPYVTKNVDIAFELSTVGDDMNIDMDVDNISEAEFTQCGQGFDGKYLF
jgi:hypothetical protein